MVNRSKQRVEITVDAGMKVRCLNQPNLAGNVILVDVSINGMSLIAGHPLEKKIDAEIQLPDRYVTKGIACKFSVKAELMWMRYSENDKTYIHGYRFVTLDEIAERCLAMLIEYEIEEDRKSLKLLIPKERHDNYTRSAIKDRLQWLSHKTKTGFAHIPRFSVDPATYKGNVENMIGVCQVPLGIAGPLKINGQEARGEFYVPLATTEGALVMTYDLGMRLITKSGGATTKVIRDAIQISPIFHIGRMSKSDEFSEWINKNYATVKDKFEGTTHHGKLISVVPVTINSHVVVKFTMFTGDAQGLNMINRAVREACEYISQSTGYSYIQRANYSGIKKVNMDNIFNGLGKSVVAEVTIPRSILKLLRVTPEQVCAYYNNCLLASVYSGMIGMNAHVANALSAIYIACGQDVADIHVSSIAYISYEMTESADLYARLYIPNLLVGTVGGGTSIGTQRECLEILDCHGSGRSKKFAEIAAASALAGEITVVAALINGEYVGAHEKYGRNKTKHLKAVA